MASIIFILDSKGKVLISKDYRGDVPFNCLDRFHSLIADMEDQELKPILTDHDVSYIYVRHNNLFLVAATKKNINASMILMYLYSLIQVFTDYFGTVEEESIRDNFVIIYELMDEMMDYGYPQATEAKILKEFITQ